jgi:hypothetical protein
MINNECYRFEKIEYQYGLLDSCVDATYIIHLESDIERMNHIESQLKMFQPSKIVYIVYNKGYAKCNKGLHKNAPAIDLVDAFITVFKHAREKNYGNILVLEDDFIFDDDIKDPEIQLDISSFLQDHHNKSFVYILGCLPHIQIPYYYNHNITLLRTGTHAIIYPKLFREKTLSIDQKTIEDWDVYHHINLSTKYMYKSPLCYQLFPITENHKNWFYVPLFSEFFEFLLYILKLDKHVEPGYSFFYNFFSHIFLFLICLLIISFLLFIYKNYNL